MDPRLFIEGLFAICSGLAVLQIRAVLNEVRAIADKVNDHGERIAVIESKVERLDRLK